MSFMIEPYKEKVSFDAELSGVSDRNLPIDCQIYLPNIWGEKVEIVMGFPFSVMPIKTTRNNTGISFSQKLNGRSIEVKGMWIQDLETKTFPARKFGLSEIKLAHVEKLVITDNLTTDNRELKIYISGSTFFNSAKNLCSFESDNVVNILEFETPNLGMIKLQSYCVKAAVNGGDKYLSSYGFCLSIGTSKNDNTPEEALKDIQPALNIISVLLRQRITIFGWEHLNGSERKRCWFDPLEPITEPPHYYFEPNCYLVSRSGFNTAVSLALKNSGNFDEAKNQLIFHLSYALSPAIKLSAAERFMSLFKTIEIQAGKLSLQRDELTTADKLLIEKLKEVDSYFSGASPELSDRVKGFIAMIDSKKLSLKEKISYLFQQEGVRLNDLWSIKDTGGLYEIRNKLTHRGSYSVSHQGLAVATWHLSTLVERLFLSITKTPIEPLILNRLSSDEWANTEFFHPLKKSIFDVKTPI